MVRNQTFSISEENIARLAQLTAVTKIDKSSLVGIAIERLTVEAIINEMRENSTGESAEQARRATDTPC